MSSWQVFGLAGCLLARLPSLNGASANRAFVPAYRCGAVPDVRRIPIFTLRVSAKNHKVN
jgi:hypothetical protein